MRDRGALVGPILVIFWDTSFLKSATLSEFKCMGPSKAAAVVLDLSNVEPALWLKAAGPQIPDANLRVVLNEKGFAMAKMLNLTALFSWFPSVDAALRQGV